MSLLHKRSVIDETTVFKCWIFVIRHNNGNDEFWFKGIDVTGCMKYKNQRQPIRINVHESFRKPWIELKTINTSNSITNESISKKWRPYTIFISEPGLYAIVNHSKKPEAKRFFKWINEDVLPKLRRNTKIDNNVALLCKDIELKKLKLELMQLKRQREKDQEKHETKLLRIQKENVTTESTCIDSTKLNYIGICCNKSLKHFKIFHQQWDTLLNNCGWILRTKKSDVEPLQTSNCESNSHLPNRLIICGEPLEIAHGVNVWQHFCTEHPDVVFGLSVSDTSNNEFTLLNELELRQKYNIYSKLDDSVIIGYSIKMHAHHERLFEMANFFDADECVARALSIDIWHLYEKLKKFVDTQNAYISNKLLEDRNTDETFTNPCNSQKTYNKEKC